MERERKSILINNQQLSDANTVSKGSLVASSNKTPFSGKEDLEEQGSKGWEQKGKEHR